MILIHFMQQHLEIMPVLFAEMQSFQNKLYCYSCVHLTGYYALRIMFGLWLFLDTLKMN